MSGFASWGLTVLGLAIVMTIAEMLLPSGKMRKVIRSVFATVTVFVIITPIPSLIKGLGGVFYPGSQIMLDKEYLEYVDDAKKAIMVSGAQQYLGQKGVEGVNLDVELDDDGVSVKYVRIDFCNSGITDEDGHINKSEIIGLIADYFGIGEEAVMTYG